MTTELYTLLDYPSQLYTTKQIIIDKVILYFRTVQPAHETRQSKTYGDWCGGVLQVRQPFWIQQSIKSRKQSFNSHYVSWHT